MKPYGSGVPLVVDTSAWSRQGEEDVSARWFVTLDAGLLAACPVASLEILNGARSQADAIALERVLGELLQAYVTTAVCHAALAAARKLGASRRLPVPDYLIAAAAAERGFGVLHQDRHYDTLATVLTFESVRLRD